MKRPLGVALLGLAAILLAVVVRKLRGGPVAAFRDSAGGGKPVDAAWPELSDEPAAPFPTDAPAPGVRPTDPALAAEEPSAVGPSDGGEGWMPPLADGGCPADHPVKAKTASGIYHLPGGVSYGRVRPDRCYADAASARADGLRPAKR